MLFFQVLLFAGYCYAHGLMRLSRRTQVSVHVVLILIAAFLLSVTPSPSSRPSGSESPVLHILILLSGTVGLPYFLLSTTGPLVQAWYARGFPGASAYRLYALSNVGSLGALLTYPLLVEPNSEVTEQTQFWSYGFWIFSVLIIGTALASLNFNAPAKADRKREYVSTSRKILWFSLAAAASTLLLAITNHICQDVAVIPFLWVVPLSLYLLSFILCFESSRWYRRNWYAPLLVVLMLLLCDPQFTGPQADVRVALLVSFAALFVACMVCHGELVALKPSTENLTEFYVLLSAGGAFGGIFVALLAPALFTAFFELQISLFVILLCLLIILFQDRASPLHGNRGHQGRIFAVAAFALLSLALAQNASRMVAGAVLQTRNFYGVLRLTEEKPDVPEEHRFVQYHGRILHGFQYTAPQRHLEPNAYFGPETGIGLTLRFFPRDTKRIGVVGLGVGTLAAYGKEGDSIIFYEINPDVIDQTTAHFTFVKQSKARTAMVLGDGRLSLERQGPQNFDVLVLDAFSGDAVPAHLLTSEAFDIYERHLADDGVIAVNITNSHLDLRPVLAGLAKERAMHTAVIHSERDEKRGYKKCDWMLLARNPEFFEQPELKEKIGERDGDYPYTIIWTDSYNNLFSILK